MRFIPTPVGNTAWKGSGSFRGAVHPHACGEHIIYVFVEYLPGGSSPRLWGTHSCNLIGFDPFRFIPTPVGNTFPLPRPRSCRPVHPHACGEHPPHHSRPKYCRGSSPRLWGTPRHAADRPFPHGSSPRLWGTHFLNFISQREGRFIPTPVGNTLECAFYMPVPSVHPHACGEHYGIIPGTKKPAVDPTPVGNTGQHSSEAPTSTVHPHACGEHRDDLPRGGG